MDAVQKAIASQCDEIRDMLLAKNQAYGNSALDPVRVFSRAPADEQIRVRMDDKISRLVRGEAAGEDVLFDLVGYIVLLLVHRKLDSASRVATRELNRDTEPR